MRAVALAIFLLALTLEYAVRGVPIPDKVAAIGAAATIAFIVCVVAGW